MSNGSKVDVHQEGNTWIFTTHGYINNLSGEAIAEEFDRAFKKGARTFILDMADSKVVNSIGVSILIEILEKTLEAKGVMAFCNCASIVEKTFKIMGITQYARVYKSLDEAKKAVS